MSFLFTANLQVWAKDAAERAAKTFLQIFLLQLVAAGWFSVNGVVDLSTPKRAALAAGGAALSVVSSAVSSLVGDKSTASLVDVSAPVVAADPALVGPGGD